MFGAEYVVHWLFYSILFKLYELESAQEGRVIEEGKVPNRARKIRSCAEPLQGPRNNIQYFSPFGPSWSHDHWQAIQHAPLDDD
jgi:hypothetical protein